MSALAEIERYLERLFERTSARVFRTRLRPVHLQRRIERAMELGRVSGPQRSVVPDRFRVRVHPSDLAGLGEVEGLEALAAQLADGALAFARAHGLQLLERPTVALVADPSIELGSIDVEATFGGKRARMNGHPDAIAPDPAVPEEVEAVATAEGLPVNHAAASFAMTADAHRGVRDPEDDLGDGTRTLVYRRPIVVGPRAVLRIVDGKGRERTVDVDGTLLGIGRAADNGLVIDDTRVSRHHGRLQARRGALVYTDLGSTNGTRVNGLVVDEIALGLGDRIELGDTTLVVESLPR